ncbi:DUF2142 domain-containing protein [Paenibacillus whitsoniae]|uniref:DUF2142 domain-containing protein n=1 Tax=Paenibacillus whitsoniae TaxID=2496558 RepID=A0A430JB74_9BACL|nr:DUF2142 domain-containing protein [Paenibacillus whitsoniae]RTE08162.1 DUF2142 domain-containing protein [Paenibacillus whitsoniae]
MIKIMRRKFIELVPIPLVLILILALLKGILWSIIIPPFQTPDEPGHFSYVQYLAEQKGLPVRGNNIDNSFSPELIQFYDFAKTEDIINNKNALFMIDSKQEKNTLSRIGTGSNYITSYPPLYYWLASIFYKFFDNLSIEYRFYSVRLFSVLLSLITVWGSYYIGKKIVPSNVLFPITISSITLLQPMYSMVSASVTNDTLMISISVLLLCWLLSCLDELEKITTSKVLLGGVLMGLGLLVKAQILYVSLFCGAILLLFLLLKKIELKRIFSLVGILLIPVVVLYGWWAVFSQKHYQSVFGVMGFKPIGFNAHGKLTGYLHEIFPSVSIGLGRIYNIWVRWVWATFGWLNITFTNDKIYKIIFILILLSSIGVIISFIRYFVLKHKINSVKIHYVFILCLFWLGNIVFLYMVEFVYYRSSLDTMLQGRYIFTALVPIVVLLVFGLQSLIKRRYHNVIYIISVLSILVLHICSMLLLLKRYYGVMIS